MSYKTGLFLFLWSMSFAVVTAQTDDFGTWTSVGVDKKLGKWNVNAEGELRTRDDASQIDRWSLKLGTSYKIVKPLQVGAGYEFINFYDGKYVDYQPRHRGFAFIQTKYELGRFSFSLRERAQVTKKDDSDRIKKSGKINTYKINPEWTWRNRLKVAYNIPKIPVTPALSVESFYQLNNPDGNSFVKLRYTMSFSYDLTKQNQFEVYGLLDNEMNVTDPGRTYIIGVGYVFSF